MKTKLCPECNSTFTCGDGRGTDRKYCGKPCYNAAHTRLAKERIASLPPCKVEGCIIAATRVGAGMCEKHYGRIRRNGSTAPRTPAYRYVNGKGYITLLEPSHPLANTRGYVYEHRKVMYASIGEAPHKCYWCDTELHTWARITVDHLNECKSDNSLGNLVVSCNACNRYRGCMLPFLDRVTVDKLPLFLKCAEAYHNRKSGRGE